MYPPGPGPTPQGPGPGQAGGIPPSALLALLGGGGMAGPSPYGPAFPAAPPLPPGGGDTDALRTLAMLASTLGPEALKELASRFPGGLPPGPIGGSYPPGPVAPGGGPGFGAPGY